MTDPLFSTAWERRDYEREKAGLLPLGPMGAQTKAKKVYLAGPMSGVPGLNFPAFRAAREKLRAEGHTVFCPAEHAEQTEREISAEKNASQAFRRRVLAIDLAWICAEADAIALLPGWDVSKGAKAERATAEALGLDVWELAP